MRVMLVNPPNSGRSIPEEEYGIVSIKQIFKGEPFALEVLAGALDGHDVAILDLKCEDEEVLWERYASFRPDVVGFTAVTCEARTVLRQAARLKEYRNTVVVVGGSHATCDPAFFNRPEIDFVVCGIGKRSFAELIGKLAAGGTGEGIPGIARTAPGRALSIVPRSYSADDLMDGCPPRYDLVEAWRDRYAVERLKMKMGFVITAYGCTHRCSFCTIPAVTGGRYLTHSPASVVRDIGLLGDIPFIRMVDANTFGDPAQSEKLCELIMAQGVKMRFVADVRADTVRENRDMLARWKEAGLFGVVVGFEDLEAGRLDAYRKKYKPEVIPEAVECLHELGLMIVGDFIVSPDYEDADFERLERFVTERKIHIPMLSVLTPIPGTPLYENMKDRIVVHDLDYYTFTNAVVRTRMSEASFYRTFSELVKRLHGKGQQTKEA